MNARRKVAIYWIPLIAADVLLAVLWEIRLPAARGASDCNSAFHADPCNPMTHQDIAFLFVPLFAGVALMIAIGLWILSGDRRSSD